MLLGVLHRVAGGTHPVSQHPAGGQHAGPQSYFAATALHLTTIDSTAPGLYASATPAATGALVAAILHAWPGSWSERLSNPVVVVRTAGRGQAEKEASKAERLDSQCKQRSNGGFHIHLLEELAVVKIMFVVAV